MTGIGRRVRECGVLPDGRTNVSFHSVGTVQYSVDDVNFGYSTANIDG